MDNDAKLKKVLDDYLDRAFIYSIMLHRAERFYNTMKMLFKMPIILTSASLSIINSNQNFDENIMKTVNIIFNILTSVILAIGTAYQFEGRENEFKSAKNKFIKLASEIEAKQLSNDAIEPSYAMAIIERYDNIQEALDYDIPGFILKSTRKKWAGLKTLPIIINGVEKQRVSTLSTIPEERIVL